MAKKQKTLKELNLEVESLSERLKTLEEKDTTKNPSEDTKNKVEEVERLIKINDQKIKDLDRMLLQAQSKLDESDKKKSDINKLNCKECGKEMESKNSMSDHIRKHHPKLHNCDNCDEKFNDSWRLELHKKTHKNITPLKCNICEKHFYVNWRLKKHIASHNESNKFCHYFNNDKVCPFEEVGCKYKHAISENCKYDKNCRFKLCQFKHTNKNETGKDIKCEACDHMATNREELSKHNKNEHEYLKYDVMDECEKQDINDYICINICWQGDHKCYDKDGDNELLGVDVKKIKEDYHNCVEEENFKCEMCDFTSNTLKNVKNHFVNNHRNNYKLDCWKCGKKFETICELRKHVGTYHH